MKNYIACLLTLLGPATLPTVGRADNSTATAIRVSPSAVVSGLAINSAGDVDFYRIDFPAAGRFTAFSEGTTDTFGCLLNSSGRVLDCNDDASVSNQNFSITRNVSGATFVYVSVRHYCRYRTGAYTLRTQFVPHSPVDPEGNTLSSALSLTLNNRAASYNGAINSPRDVDIFAVNLTAAGFLNASSSGTSDVTGRILNASGNQLAANDDVSPANRNFSMRAQLAAGRYYVEVRHYNPMATGSYRLNVRFEPVANNGSPAPTPAMRALVVGISNYQMISDLSLCDDDARAISTVLTTSGWHVTTLIDSQASKAAIQQNISRLAPGGGRFLLYFSGHGTASGTTGYFCPWDSSNLASMISETEMNAWLHVAGGATAVGVVLDSCNSGAFIGRSLAAARADGARARYYQVPGAPLPDPRAGEFMARNISLAGRVVITGCRGTQYSYEFPSLGHGWLTFQLLAALRDRRQDSTGNGWVSLEEAFVRAAPGVSISGTQRQDPQLHDGNGSAHLDTSRF
jgi:metacaspase-1